jgi:hypothetical protein
VNVPPEYASLEDFIEYMMDDEREEYDHEELGMLAYSMKLSVSKVRAILDDWGLRLADRPKEQNVRGYTSWDENRWAGNPCGGGTGWEQILGFSGQKG